MLLICHRVGEDAQGFFPETAAGEKVCELAGGVSASYSASWSG